MKKGGEGVLFLRFVLMLLIVISSFSNIYLVAAASGDYEIQGEKYNDKRFGERFFDGIEKVKDDVSRGINSVKNIGLEKKFNILNLKLKSGLTGNVVLEPENVDEYCAQVDNSKFTAPKNYIRGFVKERDMLVKDGKSEICGLLPTEIAFKNFAPVSANSIDNVFDLEKFYAEHKETSIGADGNMISCALKKDEAEYLTSEQIMTGSSLIYVDDEVFRLAVAHYYDVMNKLKFGQMTALENIAATQAFVFGNDPVGLNDPVNNLISNDNPFQEDLNSARAKISDSLHIDSDRIVKETKELFDYLILPLEKENHKFQLRLTCNGITDEQRTQMLDKISKNQETIDSLKIVKAPYTRGDVFAQNYKLIYDTNTVAPISIFCTTDDETTRDVIADAHFGGDMKSAINSQLLTNQYSLLGSLNEMNKASVLMNDPEADYDAVKAQLEVALKKIPIIPPWIAHNGKDDINIDIANEYMNSAGLVSREIARLDAKKDFVRDLWITAGLVYTGGFLGGASALAADGLKIGRVVDTAVIVLGLVVVGSDIYFSKASIDNAISTCNNAFDEWDIPLGVTGDQNAIASFGPTVIPDYQSCLIAAIISGVQVGAVALTAPPFVEDFLLTAKGARVKAVLSADTEDVPFKMVVRSLEYDAKRTYFKVFVKGENEASETELKIINAFIKKRDSVAAGKIFREMAMEKKYTDLTELSDSQIVDAVGARMISDGFEKELDDVVLKNQQALGIWHFGKEDITTYDIGVPELRSPKVCKISDDGKLTLSGDTEGTIFFRKTPLSSDMEQIYGGEWLEMGKVASEGESSMDVLKIARTGLEMMEEKRPGVKVVFATNLDNARQWAKISPNGVIPENFDKKTMSQVASQVSKIAKPVGINVGGKNYDISVQYFVSEIPEPEKSISDLSRIINRFGKR